MYCREYLAKGCLIFRSHYYNGVDTQENWAARNEDNESSQANEASLTFGQFEQYIGTSAIQGLDPIELMDTHRYVLYKYDSIKELIE